MAANEIPNLICRQEQQQTLQLLSAVISWPQQVCEVWLQKASGAQTAIKQRAARAGKTTENIQ